MEHGAPSKTVMGAGEYEGGTFDEVRVFGASEFRGDVSCNVLRVRGSCEFERDVRAGRASIAGAVDVAGDLRADALKVYGAMDVRGHLSGSRLRINGTCDVGGAVRAESVLVRGAVDVKGDVEAARVRLKGGISIGGLVSADEVLIEPYRRCTVRQIGGGRLAVRRSRRQALFFPIGVGGGLRAREIEVDEIDLAGTMAEVVRCRRGRVGPGCRIRTLYSDGEVEVDPRATVERHVKE